MIVENISYSALSTWQHCPHYFKLLYVDKVRDFENTIWTHFGTLVHKYLQDVLKGNIEASVAAAKLVKTWTRFVKMFESKLNTQVNKDINIYNFAIPAFKAVLDVKKTFKKEFGKFKVIGTEIRLNSPMEKYPQIFKGFIDIVLETPDNIIIVDFKTCSSSYMFNKFKDKYKDYQLTLYKHFYAKQFNVDLDKIVTYFATVERNENSKVPLRFFRITSGPKKIKNALGWLEAALDAINKERWLKNKTACHKFSSSPYKNDRSCEFYNTEWCSFSSKK